MLVLGMKKGQCIRIGDNIFVWICDVRAGSDHVRIGIEAPRDVNIVRCELLPEGERPNAPRTVSWLRPGRHRLPLRRRGCVMATATMATATLDGDSIVIRGPQNPTMNEFYRSLPGGRFSAKHNAWLCSATPVAAWRLRHAPVEFTLDQGLSETARSIEERVIGDQQPAIRKGPAWGHQVAAFNFARGLHSAMLAMWMGTGKSKVAVDLIQNRQCRSVLVVCPKSVMAVWRREFARHCAVPHDVLILDGSGTVARRTAEAILHLKTCQARNVMPVVVVNYESAWRPDFLDFATAQQWGAVVCDESHRIKAHNSSCSKALHKIGQAADYRLCLTGTPMPHSPMDLFGQFRFLDPGVYGSSYHWFRSRYAISGHFGADHIVGFRNQEELAQRMALLTYQADKSVLKDLPEELHEAVEVELGPEGRRIYDKLETTSIVEVKAGLVTASNALVRLLRLQQMTGGIAATESGEQELIDTAKMLAAEELIDGMTEPVVVFCRFRADLDAVHRIGERLNRRTGEISGRRKDLTETATMPDYIDIMAVQVQSGGVGVDLTRARYGIYWGHPWSLGDYDQSLNRIHRPGQTRSVTYYHLIARRTVDEAVWKALQTKRDVVEGVLAYLKGEQK